MVCLHFLTQTTTMPVNHQCTSDCFNKRTANKNIINCQKCSHRCNLQCFGVPSSVSQNDLKGDHNIIFVCTRCFNNQFKGRRSTDKPSSVNLNGSAPSIDGNTSSKAADNVNTDSNSSQSRSSNIHNENSKMLSKIFDILGELSQKCDNNKNFDDISNDMKTIMTRTDDIKNLHTVHNNTSTNNDNQQIISLHAKLDQFILNSKKPNNAERDNLTKLIDDLHCKMDVIISDPRFIHKQNVNNIVQKRSKTALADDFEWSFSFNQSMNAALNTENADIYSLLTSFEQNTWAGLDLLRNKICEMQNTILSIETSCKNWDSSDASRKNDTPMISALTNSIEIDT